MRLLQSTGATGGRTPGGAFTPRSIDGPAERRGPAASTSTPLDLTRLPDAAKLEIPEHLDDDFDYAVHVYRPAGSAQGAGPSYFRVDITGKRTLKKLQTMPKDVIFLLDTSGSTRYNVGLSERRASVVRDALVSRGMSAGAIRTEARGETDLARATRDGVREPLNRRTAVTITFR